MNATIAIRTHAGHAATVTVTSRQENGGTKTVFFLDLDGIGKQNSIWSDGSKAEVDKRIRAHLKGFIANYGTRVRASRSKPVESLTTQELYDELVEVALAPAPASKKLIVRPPLRETFSIARTGEFTVVLSGNTHCSLGGVNERTLKFEVYCRMAGAHGLDEQGFIIDNVDIQKRFNEVRVCSVSCELLCQQMADLIAQDLGERALYLREIKVRVWGVPNQAFAEYRAEA